MGKADDAGSETRAVRADLPMRGYFLVSRWKAAWEEYLGTTLSWGEFLTGMANDRAHWPKEKRA